MSIDELRRLLAPLLARRHTAIQRRELADALRELAAQQDALADADQRVGHQVRRAALDSAPRSVKGGRPRGTGARFLRWEAAQIDAEGRQLRSGYLHVGRALYQELGEPAFVRLDRAGTAIMLTPCAERDSRARTVTVPINGMPRIAVGTTMAQGLGLVARRYDAEIRDGAIVAQIAP